MDPPDQHPPIAIDCTRPYPADQYFACGQAQVVDSPLGLYRQAEAQRALAELDQAAAGGHFIPGADTLRQGIERALNEGRLAWLRRALYSYPVRRCRQLLASAP
ncbi:MAG: hypothetical protein HYW07_10455 [Candidatus Latescibacteria bacterium]|nr:hypothetical protein [Candidatus Latescibacterota bacterium]